MKSTVMKVPRPSARVTDVGLVAFALVDAWLSAWPQGGAALALSLVACPALLLRRRWPLVAFALTLPALYVAYVLIAPLVALYTVAATSPNWGPIVVCGLLTAWGNFAPWPPTDFELPHHPRDLLGLIYAGVFAGAPVAVGLLARTREELSDRLTELTIGREREKQLLTERVLAQERARLAREMHDVVSHQVSLVAVQAGALRVTTQDPGVRETADTIRELSVRTLEELRQMVGVLRASGCNTSQLAPQPRLSDIPRLVRDSGHHADVQLDGVAGRSWSEPVERAVYRSVQEALTNASKHAPGAAVTVKVTPYASGLRVTVRNAPATGPPTDSMPSGGHGLVGLRQRTELLGGSMRAGPTGDGGFLIDVALPDTQPVAASPGD